ncbi:TraR/DksA C4-type zinc finger protein [Bacillus sp. T3]|uniref:TraR/DksA C4-type zinc finger protein n=1 Tax=Bacillus sp. T3 TaxID=467262 RepID=UPI0029828C4A|nr:TraR/DksA C4-type zinc finger protein [Bacillus sp. T3]
MLTSEQLSNFRKQLNDEKQDLLMRFEQNDHFGLERGHYHESMGELSSYDNHPADEGTDLYEREKDIALNEHEELHLRNIDKALKSIDQGTYGKCEVCGVEIPLERLEVLPTTTYCKEHSPDRLVSHKRPLEEGVLMPPFGKFDLDEEDESVAYDAEDSWQEVAEWGTSESPSDFAFPNDRYENSYNEADEKIGYVEDFENFIGNDMYGKNVTVYPNELHDQYEDTLDEEGIMTTFGDLPAVEHDPYTEEEAEK